MGGRHAAIAGMGSALPAREVPNAELERMVDTSDEWIHSRTGIRARRFAGEGETAATMAASAATDALASAGIDPAAVDLTVVATISGDQPLPSTASFVQEQLGISGAAFDLAAACAGFIYATEVAAAQIVTGRAETALVIGTEVLSRFLNFSDRTTCVLFGDGAGAALLEPGREPGIIQSLLALDGTQAELLTVPAGGAAEPISEETLKARRNLLRMIDGQSVFKQAVTAMAAACTEVLEKAGVAASDLALVIGHQANSRILTALGKRLGLDPEKVLIDIAWVGNTSAASIPIALDGAWRRGMLAPGDLVLTAAFGAGMSWGASLIRWTMAAPVDPEPALHLEAAARA
jgi:3-oxoacyl-[acyl-carrier-protein] synthase III